MSILTDPIVVEVRFTISAEACETRMFERGETPESAAHAREFAVDEIHDAACRRHGGGVEATWLKRHPATPCREQLERLRSSSDPDVKALLAAYDNLLTENGNATTAESV